METILFVCSLVACIIGVLTFVVGMTSRAKNDGVVLQKINQAVDGIEELKSDIKGLTSEQNSLSLKVNSHEEKIKTLFKNQEDANITNQAILEILRILRAHEDRS